MAESNQKSLNDSQVILQRRLAKETYDLETKKLSLTGRLSKIYAIIDQLEGIAVELFEGDDAASETWIKNHPITLMLMMRLKFETLDPSMSFITIKSRIEDMLCNG